MHQLILDDDLWTQIEPLLPPPKARRTRYVGRKPLDDRALLSGILVVLQSGVRWQMLPREMGYGSGMSCWRRLRDWQQANAWSRIQALLSVKLSAADCIDWARVDADAAPVSANRPARSRDQASLAARAVSLSPH